MPFFGHVVVDESTYEPIIDQGALLEAFAADMISEMPVEERTVFLASDDCKAMVEAGIIGKKTVVRLSRNDDLTRRVKIAAFMKAKEKGDPLWNKLVQNRVKERQLINALSNKYSNLVKRDAIKAQKELIKINPKAFNRAIGR